MAGFRSLRQRLAGPPDVSDVLPLTVPPHMRQPLGDWLSEEGTAEAWTVLCQMLQIDYAGSYPRQAAYEAAARDSDLLLDLVDARLRLGGAHDLDRLAGILFFGGSGWRLDDEREGLEQVVDETVREAAQDAIDKAEPSAAQHLRAAWAAAHSRDRNPTLAHAEMVRAVESAARPVLTPSDSYATLGTLIGQLGSQSGLYTTSGASAANDGVSTLVSMMKALWQTQTDRHGANPTVPATQERVEFLMPIAAALVHAFSSGAVHRS